MSLPDISLNACWDSFKPSITLNRIGGSENGWMTGTKMMKIVMELVIRSFLVTVTGDVLHA